MPLFAVLSDQISRERLTQLLGIDLIDVIVLFLQVDL